MSLANLVDLTPKRICVCGFSQNMDALVKHFPLASVIVSTPEELVLARRLTPMAKMDDGSEDMIAKDVQLAVFSHHPSQRLILQALNNDVAVLLLEPLQLERSELMALFRTAELRNVRFMARNVFLPWTLNIPEERYFAICAFCDSQADPLESAALAIMACCPEKIPVRILCALTKVWFVDFKDGTTMGVYVSKQKEKDSISDVEAVIYALEGNAKEMIMSEQTAVWARALVDTHASSRPGEGWLNVPAYRIYVQGITPPRVVNLYRQQRKEQSHATALRLMHQYCTGGNLCCTMWDALQLLRKIVDKSDPDVLTLANDAHALQTAAMLERDGLPEHVVAIGLIHDLGKILVTFGRDEDGTSDDEQWAVVGDTFVVGHPIPDCVPFPEFNALNPDYGKPSVYTQGCGLENVVCSHGHDEYLYRALVRNQKHHSLPEECLYIARFHSLYAWHTGGAYTELESPKDREMKRWVRRFQAADLYGKEDELCESWDNPKWRELVERVFGTEEWDW